MRTIYRIKVKSLRGETLFEYSAPTHPKEGEFVYYRAKTYRVSFVGHVLMTMVGAAGENNTLGYIELEVGGG